MPLSNIQFKKFILSLAVSIASCLLIAFLAFWFWSTLFGQTKSSGHTEFPWVLMLSGFGMVATSASLGTAMSQSDPRAFNRLLSVTQIVGALFLGWQCYGIWCLKNVFFTLNLKNALAPLALVSCHFTATVLIFLGLVTSIAWLRSTSALSRDTTDTEMLLSKEERTLRLPLKFLSLVWFGLSVLWVWVMCIVPAFL